MTSHAWATVALTMSHYTFNISRFSSPALPHFFLFHCLTRRRFCFDLHAESEWSLCSSQQEAKMKRQPDTSGSTALSCWYLTLMDYWMTADVADDGGNCMTRQKSERQLGFFTLCIFCFPTCLSAHLSLSLSFFFFFRFALGRWREHFPEVILLPQKNTSWSLSVCLPVAHSYINMSPHGGVQSCHYNNIISTPPVLRRGAL